MRFGAEVNSDHDPPIPVTEFPPFVIPPNETKAARERRVFTTFAAYASKYIGFSVVSGSIVSRDPPEPDILCSICDEGPVAFELGEILDQRAQQVNATMMGVRGDLIAHRWKLSGADQVTFQTKFATKEVRVGFRQDRALRQLQASIPVLYEWLVHQVADDVSGDIVPPQGALLENIELISIRSPGPPFIDVAFGLRVQDATLLLAAPKLLRDCYKVRSPVELLLYSHDQPFATRESRIESLLAGIAPLVDASIARGHFRRVWVFSVAERYQDSAIKLIYPPWQSSQVPTGNASRDDKR
jgi:hypothetical protein